MRKQWHLDIPLDPILFEGNWSSSSQLLLQSLFQHLDAAPTPVLSMLPPGITPAGAAAAAALYFLPGMQNPPVPACRIAVYPGLHFVRQIKGINLDSIALWRTGQRARVSGRGRAGIHGSFERLRQEQKEREKAGVATAEPVSFHWIFKCRRVWTRLHEVETTDLLPRSYYGRNDPFESTIDFIETDSIEKISDQSNPYDLLIYAPYFHSRSVERTESDIQHLVGKISKFSAHRKLVVARSPYDYWSKKMEERLKINGVALPPEVPSEGNREGLKPNITFHNVEQIINAEEARDLFLGMEGITRGPDVNWILVNELKFHLRRLLISVDPRTRHGEEPRETIVRKILGLADSLGLSRNEKAMKSIHLIDERVRTSTWKSKIDVIRQLVTERKSEIWVTTGLDRQILEELKVRHSLDFTIRLMNRWSTPGEREPGRRVILSRVDREIDLDLVVYLKSEDAVVISSWETVARGRTILKSWERSEKWRENASRLGILHKRQGETLVDPVLELANLMDSAAPKVQLNSQQEDQDSGGASWWDDRDAGSILATSEGRDELLKKMGTQTAVCRELYFDGGAGMFVPEDDELLVVEEEDGEGDIVSKPVLEVAQGHTVIFFQDNERGSFFDILMDQLERSPEYKADAKKVREWKHALRDRVVERRLKIPQLAEELSGGLKRFEPITVASWVYGSTMAPLRHEQLVRLVHVLGMSQIDTKKLFASVRRLRVIARALGRALNEILIHKSLDRIEPDILAALQSAGIDVGEMAGAIEARRIAGIARDSVEIDIKNAKKLWLLSDGLKV